MKRNFSLTGSNHPEQSEKILSFFGSRFGSPSFLSLFVLPCVAESPSHSFLWWGHDVFRVCFWTSKERSRTTFDWGQRWRICNSEKTNIVFSTCIVLFENSTKFVGPRNVKGLISIEGFERTMNLGLTAWLPDLALCSTRWLWSQLDEKTCKKLATLLKLPPLQLLLPSHC